MISVFGFISSMLVILLGTACVSWCVTLVETVPRGGRLLKFPAVKLPGAIHRYPELQAVTCGVVTDDRARQVLEAERREHVLGVGRALCYAMVCENMSWV